MVTLRALAARATVAGGALASLAPACKPTLDETVSVVNEPIVLAVKSEPAEGAPGTPLKYEALYVDGSGPVAKPRVEWDFCEARKPLAELGPVNLECERPNGSWFVPLGEGANVSGTLPADACKLFGPDVPPAIVGQPQGRPVDPDATGGYYEPVRILSTGGAVTVAETRLSCGSGAVPPNLGVDYAHRYHANANPAVASLAVVGDRGAPVPLATSDRGTNPVTAGARLAFRLSWSSCPVTTDVCDDGVCGPDETNVSCPADCTVPAGCSGAERFLAFDVASQTLRVERESMAAAWYATAGSFDSDRTGREATDPATTSDNAWTAPSGPEKVHAWVVLRDDRGGIGWAEYVLDVR